jgi:hypothetical protein
MGHLYALLLLTNSAKPKVQHQTIYTSIKELFGPLARLRERAGSKGENIARLR